MVGGSVAPGYEAVRDAFAACHPSEVGGGQLCVYRGGRPVVDLWAGEGYDGDTLGVMMSCTKGAVAITVHALVERGELDLTSPIARWWPKFAANGKDAITLTHVLTHSSGLFGWAVDSGMDGAAALDWERSTSALAAMAPYWPPGEAALYHFITYGYLVGETVRRATGKTIGAQFAELVARPLGLDFWIGLPEALNVRVALHVRGAPAPGEAATLGMFGAMGLDTSLPVLKGLAQTMAATDGLIDLMNTPAGRAVEVPAGNGVGNARALARMYGACLGEVDGVRLLKPETVAAMTQPQTDHIGPPPPFPRTDPMSVQRFGLGFELERAPIPLLGPRCFGHPGAGGRLGFADPASGMSVGYACNGMLWDGRTPDPRWAWLAPLRQIASAA